MTLRTATQPTIRHATRRDRDTIFTINRDARPWVSEFSVAYFEQLMRECSRFVVVEAEGRVAGYLCAMDRCANYDGEEFRWFRRHFDEDFLYIDQVAVGRRFRRTGLGRALYDDLERFAGRKGIGTLTCEVDCKPMNARSQAFHGGRGFAEVGTIETRGVSVSLLAKRGLAGAGRDGPAAGQTSISRTFASSLRFARPGVLT